MSDPVTGPEERPAGFAQAFAEQFSFEQAIGGPRGLIEAVVPMTLFSVAYGAGASMRASVIAAVVSSVAFAIWRLIAREPLTHAVSGVLGIGLGAYLAMRTGRAENFALPSLVKNSAQAAVFGVSALTRWPLLGLMIGLLRGEGLAWRADPARLRAYRLATWLWAGMFVVRLAVQVPLWRAHAAAALGFANVVLGLPLFGAVLWLTWMIVRAHHGDLADLTGGARAGAGGDGTAPADAEAGAAPDAAAQERAAQERARAAEAVRPDASPG